MCVGENLLHECVYVSSVSQVPPLDLQTTRGRKADSVDSEAEDGLSSLGSDLWAALEHRWVSVGLGGVAATLGLDNKVSHIMELLFNILKTMKSICQDIYIYIYNIYLQ